MADVLIRSTHVDLRTEVEVDLSFSVPEWDLRMSGDVSSGS